MTDIVVDPSIPLLRGFGGKIQYNDKIIEPKVWFWEPGSPLFVVRITNEDFLAHYKSLINRAVDIRLENGMTLEEHVSLIKQDDRSKSIKATDISFQGILAIEEALEKGIPKADTLLSKLSAKEVNGVIVSEFMISS